MAQLDYYIDENGTEHAVCQECGGCMACGCECTEDPNGGDILRSDDTPG